jgi:hypothetical protein
MGADAFRFVARCERCGMLRVEHYRGLWSNPGACDTDEDAVAVARERVHDFGDGTCVCWPDGEVEYVYS